MFQVRVLLKHVHIHNMLSLCYTVTLLVHDESQHTPELDPLSTVTVVVGVEIDDSCGSLQTFDNILSLNVSGSGSTSTVYRRSSTSSLRLTPSSPTVFIFTMNHLIPLVTPIVLPTIGQCI